MLTSLMLLVGMVLGGVKVGDEPPDYIGKDIHGNEVRLSQYRGRVVVIDFWASWCSPCREELAVLDRIQRQVSPQRLVVLAVNWREGSNRFRQIVEVLGENTKLTLLDDAKGSISAPYNIHAIPFVVVIGMDGRIADIRRGFSKSLTPQFVEELNKLLAVDAAPAGVAQ